MCSGFTLRIEVPGEMQSRDCSLETGNCVGGQHSAGISADSNRLQHRKRPPPWARQIGGALQSLQSGDDAQLRFILFRFLRQSQSILCWTLHSGKFSPDFNLPSRLSGAAIFRLCRALTAGRNRGNGALPADHRPLSPGGPAGGGAPGAMRIPAGRDAHPCGARFARRADNKEGDEAVGSACAGAADTTSARLALPAARRLTGAVTRCSLPSQIDPPFLARRPKNCSLHLLPRFALCH